MKRRKLVWIVLLAVAVGIGGAAAPYALDGKVQYHRLQYRLANAVLLPAAAWFSHSGWTNEWLFIVTLRARFRAAYQKEYHRQRLVDLGALSYCQIEFKNISQKSRESDHLWRTCYSQVAPGFHDLTFWDCTPVHIAVWCDPSNRDAWKRFVVKYDVPNYWEIRDQSVVATGPLAD